MENTIDIASFFTKKNEEEGIWYEPKVEGRGIGIEFKLLGKASDANTIASEVYEKETDEASKEKDAVKRRDKNDKALAKRFAAVVTDVRATEGNTVFIEGKPLTYSRETVEYILLQSSVISEDILRAFIERENFMTKKH